MEFASVFSALRRKAGLSQRQAAQELGISQALLSHYENGLREPRLEFVVTLCDYFHVSADTLLGRGEASPAPDDASPAVLAAAEYLCLQELLLSVPPEDPRGELLAAAAMLARRDYRLAAPEADAAHQGAQLYIHQPQRVREAALRRVARLESEG